MKVGILFFLAVGVVSASVFDDRCPTLKPGTVGICLYGCGSNEDCIGGKICCSTGCGSICRSVPSTVTKPPCKNIVNCFIDPCTVASCPGNPDAICRSNYCGGCNAEFFDENGLKVNNCMKIKPKVCGPVCANYCRYGRVYQDGCPTCTCKGPIKLPFE